MRNLAVRVLIPNGSTCVSRRYSPSKEQRDSGSLPQGVAEGVRRGVIMASAIGRVGRHGKYTLPYLTNLWQAPETPNIGGNPRFLASAAPLDRTRPDVSAADC